MTTIHITIFAKTQASEKFESLLAAHIIQRFIYNWDAITLSSLVLIPISEHVEKRKERTRNPKVLIRPECWKGAWPTPRGPTTTGPPSCPTTWRPPPGSTSARSARGRAPTHPWVQHPIWIVCCGRIPVALAGQQFVPEPILFQFIGVFLL